MLVDKLVRRPVSVIVALESTNSALAAKAATQTIPVVFMQSADPIRIGLVKSLNRPGGNLTGINLLLAETAGKRFELLLELVPAAKTVAHLGNLVILFMRKPTQAKRRLRRVLMGYASSSQMQVGQARVAFAFGNETGSTAFSDNFGPSNSAMLNTTTGDAAFATAACATIFDAASTAKSGQRDADLRLQLEGVLHIS
jgi:hypothetical protein